MGGRSWISSIARTPKDVARAKRQKRAAFKKRKPAPVVVLSRMVTRPSSISTPGCPDAGLGLVGV